MALGFALVTLGASATATEDVAVRVRDDGRVDVRVKAASLVSVLDRLASQTGMRVTYQGPLPRRIVSLEVHGANHAQAVLEVLDGLGADYAATLDPAGTRVLSLVVAGTAPPAAGVATKPDPVEPAPIVLPQATEPDVEPEDGTSAGTDEQYVPLAGDFVPGSRATGQPTEWGMPAFVLPDPPDGAAPADASPHESPSPPTPTPAPTPVP